MSAYAILKGLETHIRNNISTWDETNCKAMPDGKPDPIAGDLFCACHMIRSRTYRQDDAGDIDRRRLAEDYSFGVTVTKKIEAIPYDSVTETVYLTQISGLDLETEKIKYLIHASWQFTREVNNLLACDDADVNNLVYSWAFYRPPLLANPEAVPRFRNEQWFFGTHGDPSRNAQDGSSGISLTLEFGRFERETILINQDCPG